MYTLLEINVESLKKKTYLKNFKRFYLKADFKKSKLKVPNGKLWTSDSSQVNFLINLTFGLKRRRESPKSELNIEKRTRP